MDRQAIKDFSIAELVVLQHKLKEFPEDKEDWELVMAEIKERGKQDIQSGDLVPIDNTTELAIRAGIEQEGFSKYDASCVSVRERVGVMNSRVFRLKIEFAQEVALDYLESLTTVDQFIYLGRHFAKDLQLKVSRLLPNIRIGDKIIMSIKEYEKLRQQAMESRVRF